MTTIHHRHRTIIRSTAVYALAAAALLVGTAAGAAERVVLGEYFTNLY